MQGRPRGPGSCSPQPDPQSHLCPCRRAGNAGAVRRPTHGRFAGHRVAGDPPRADGGDHQHGAQQLMLTLPLALALTLMLTRQHRWWRSSTRR